MLLKKELKKKKVSMPTQKIACRHTRQLVFPGKQQNGGLLSVISRNGRRHRGRWALPCFAVTFTNGKCEKEKMLSKHREHFGCF